MRAFLAIVILLATVTPAAAEWILYEKSPRGTWLGVSGMYKDLAQCETDAKARAETKQTNTGCAVPPEARALTAAEKAEQARYTGAAKANRAKDEARAAAEAEALQTEVQAERAQAATDERTKQVIDERAACQRLRQLGC